jgi:hypothetical protein
MDCLEFLFHYPSDVRFHVATLAVADISPYPGQRLSGDEILSSQLQE